MVDYSGKTIRWCRRLGWPAESVYKPATIYTHRSKDLWDGIDVLAIDNQYGSLAIQATGKRAAAVHITKLRRVVSAWPEFLAAKLAKKNGEREWGQVPKIHPLVLWLEAENRLQVWNWRLVSVKRGGKQKVWRPRGLSLTVSSLTSASAPEVSSLEIEIPRPPGLRDP